MYSIIAFDKGVVMDMLMSYTSQKKTLKTGTRITNNPDL